GGERDDRDIGRLRIRLELARGSPTLHLRHAEVHHDQVGTLPAGEGQGGATVGRLEGLVALEGQYLDHDTAVVRLVLGDQYALCHAAALLSAEVPHAEQHGAAGEYEEPVGGRDGGALLVEREAPRDIEERAGCG